jgi:hypothetical protein
MQIEVRNMDDNVSRNPFGVMDVPEPNSDDVVAFAAETTLHGAADDANATAWSTLGRQPASPPLEGEWASRWNGGADPAVPGDAPENWKTGRAELRCAGRRLYIRFDWHGGARQGLIDAERHGAARLVGKYINLSNPAITRPWVGLIVSHDRIDGRWSNGRLDFRR